MHGHHSLTDADIVEAGRETGLGGGEIGFGRHLHIGRFSGKDMHIMAGECGDGSIVRQLLSRRSPMRGENQVEMEDLRVCTARKIARSGVATIRPASFTSAIVSLTATAGIAAPWLRPAAMAAAIRAGEGNGLAPS